MKPLSSCSVQDEITILNQIIQGDEKAFEALFRQHYQGLCGYAYRFLQDQDESEEIVQQVLTDLWLSRDQLNITSSLKSYLFRAVHNKSLNHIKHLKVRQEHASHVVATTKEGDFDHEDSPQFELQQELEKAMNLLPTECQRIFRMQKLDGLKYKEISDVLGISVKTVENQIGKALKILRQELKHLLPAILIEIILNNENWPWT